MTTTTEINEILFSHPITKGFYGGTWALDEAVQVISAVPHNVKSCYVVNSCPSNHAGSHWTAVWIDSGTEHFCSYGMPPPTALHQALGDAYKRSTTQLQSIGTELCGYYCMLYLMCKCKGISMEKFLSCFSNNPSINDAIVKLAWSNG